MENPLTYVNATSSNAATPTATRRPRQAAHAARAASAAGTMSGTGRKCEISENARYSTAGTRLLIPEIERE